MVYELETLIKEAP